MYMVKTGSERAGTMPTVTEEWRPSMPSLVALGMPAVLVLDPWNKGLAAGRNSVGAGPMQSLLRRLDFQALPRRVAPSAARSYAGTLAAPRPGQPAVEPFAREQEARRIRAARITWSG